MPFPGFGTIVALMVMLFGILFCLLGIVSIYIGQIYEEVKVGPILWFARPSASTTRRLPPAQLRWIRATARTRHVGLRHRVTGG